jgi:hypothetical protein
MSRDDVTAAYDEWYVDAIKDSSRMPNRWEAFYAGWQARMEFIENGGQDNDKVFTKEELAGRVDY